MRWRGVRQLDEKKALLPPCPLCVADVLCSREYCPSYRYSSTSVWSVKIDYLPNVLEFSFYYYTRVLLLLLQSLLWFSYQIFLLCFAPGRYRPSFSYISTSVRSVKIDYLPNVLEFSFYYCKVFCHFLSRNFPAVLCSREVSPFLQIHFHVC
jgi:hypothetical protein